MIDRPAAEERVSSVVDDLDMTINDIRQAIFALQARGKAAPVLRDKVMDVIEEMTEPMGMTSSLRLTGQPGRRGSPGTSARTCCTRCARRCRMRPATGRPPAPR